MHGKFHRVLARRILEAYDSEEQDKLLGLVDEIDKYMASRLSKYEDTENTESIRKTAAAVAKDKRRRREDG